MVQFVPRTSYMLGLDRHASAVYVSKKDVTCIHLKAATTVTTSILPDNGLWPKSLTLLVIV